MGAKSVSLGTSVRKLAEEAAVEIQALQLRELHKEGGQRLDYAQVADVNRPQKEAPSAVVEHHVGREVACVFVEQLAAEAGWEVRDVNGPKQPRSVVLFDVNGGAGVVPSPHVGANHQTHVPQVGFHEPLDFFLRDHPAIVHDLFAHRAQRQVGVGVVAGS